MDRYTVCMFVIGGISVAVFVVAEILKHLEARKREARAINYLRYSRQRAMEVFVATGSQPGDPLEQLLLEVHREQKGHQLQ